MLPGSLGVDTGTQRFMRCVADPPDPPDPRDKTGAVPQLQFFVASCEVTLKLYPNARQAERFTAWVRLCREPYNLALQEHIDTHTPGTGVAARPKLLARQRVRLQSVTREIFATKTQGFYQVGESSFCVPGPVESARSRAGDLSFIGGLCTLRAGCGGFCYPLQFKGMG